MKKYSWLIDRPGLIVLLVGTALLWLGFADRVEIAGQALDLTHERPRELLRLLGWPMVAAGFLLTGLNAVLRFQPFNVRPLRGSKEIYREARRMIEQCDGDEIIRATSISTSLPKDSDPDREDVEKYIAYLATRCGTAKGNDHSLIYKTVIGFVLEDGRPPPHKHRAIHKRLDSFAQADAADRLVMRYLETSWSLDVLILGSNEMLIAFPTLPNNRQLMMGLRIKNKSFVASAVRWYDDCVWSIAKPLDTFERELTASK